MVPFNTEFYVLLNEATETATGDYQKSIKRAPRQTYAYTHEKKYRIESLQNLNTRGAVENQWTFRHTLNLFNFNVLLTEMWYDIKLVLVNRPYLVGTQFIELYKILFSFSNVSLIIAVWWKLQNKNQLIYFFM